MIITMENYKTYNMDNPGTIRLYTLEEAEKIINKRKFYFLKQRLCGMVMLGIGMVCPILMDCDITVSFLSIPLVIGLLVTEQRVMSFRK